MPVTRTVTRIIYECDACGRFDLKPIPPNHFHPNVHDGVCGQPTVAREYYRAAEVKAA